MDSPRGIAVHPSLGKIYWTDWDRYGSRIEMANMDGSGRQVSFLKYQIDFCIASDFGEREPKKEFRFQLKLEYGNLTISRFQLILEKVNPTVTRFQLILEKVNLTISRFQLILEQVNPTISRFLLILDQVNITISRF